MPSLKTIKVGPEPDNIAPNAPASMAEAIKYFIFGKEGAKYLAADLSIPFLGALPLVQSIREAGDIGRPAAMQEQTVVADAFTEVTRAVVSEVVRRNEQLPPTEAIKITTMAGCAAVTKK